MDDLNDAIISEEDLSSQTPPVEEQEAAAAAALITENNRIKRQKSRLNQSILKRQKDLDDNALKKRETARFIPAPLLYL